MRYILLSLALVLLGSCGEQPESKPRPAPRPRPADARGRGDGSGPAGEPQPIDPAQTGGVAGTVFFEGDAPERKPIDVSAGGGCSAEHEVLTEQVIVNGGRLQNAFVYVKRGMEGWIVPPAATAQAVLDQRGCVYVPHVQGIRIGQPLAIKNSDPATHNVNARPRRSQNQAFNQAQPKGAADLVREFGEVEVAIRFECNIHPWMNAWVAVLDHPFFAVSGADGSFEIAGLPPGEYELEAWHEKYKRATLSVTVQAGQTAEAEFTFAP